MSQRYCIGCAHLKYDSKQMRGGSSRTGIWTAEDAALSCTKKHWHMYITEGPVGGLDLERAMEHAATCHDFVERR